ncbi:conserved hypothetical protein [Nostocoides japonicum T1-X7]|uniref:Uncharacterized protein n=2 Tax=Nostocoides japonicum TaxID=99481 RepID=A0A077M5Q4_9MICO|nr:conserved hypothetical protein [Tetrasphaera japonica T1-X7]
MTGVDQRSVGELLLEADHTARSILVDVGDMDAATMLRTWGEVVQGAAELWRALPTTTPPLPGTARRTPDAADLTMQRLEAMTNARHRRREAGWPGDGPPDERHLQIAGAFARAEDLISRHASRPVVLNARQRADLDAARTRIMHTLYLGAHGVSVAVGHHLRGLESKVAIHGTLPAGQSLRQVRTAYEHLAAFEQLAGAIVAKTYPAALAGEHRDPPAASRLAQALADWDVVAHRALVDDPRTADLMLAARTQALILTGSNALLRSAAAAGYVDRTHHDDRLEPALVATQERWETLAVTMAALTPPHERRTNPDLTAASLEVRATLRELLLDAATTATPALIAQRTDLGLIPSTVGQALAANLDLAHLTSQALHDRRLTGAARGIHDMATAIWRSESHPNMIDGSPLQAAVAPKDLLANRAIPLPRAIRGQILDAAGSLVEVAATAMSAGSQLGGRAPALPRDADPSSSPGRVTQDRVVGLGTSRDLPAMGCER